MELSERKLKILQAIISDFIDGAEPVGSRSLAYRLGLGLSPATIRNEMADLEAMGYLYHPHTSAGRVPTDRAYRLYVNRLMEKYELDQREKLRIRRALQGNISQLRRTIQEASELLSEITNLTSFATLEEDSRDISLFLQGMTRIFAHPEYSTIEQARSFLEMVDDRDTLQSTIAERPEGLQVTIGAENPVRITPGSSIVTATYYVDGRLVGRLGVIGPTRMRYGEVTSVIEYMTDNLDRAFRMEDGKETDDAEE